MALTQNEISTRFYKRRKNNGLCPRCGKPLDREGHYCLACLEKYRIYQRENRNFYREHHICTACGKEKVFGSDKTCPECRVKAYNQRKPLTEEQKKRYKEHFNQQQKRLYDERKKEGICVCCGKRKAAPGRTRCSICLIKNAEQKRKGRLARSERPNYGLCYICGNAIDREGRTCTNCAEMLARNLPKERSNDFWKQDNSLI